MKDIQGTLELAQALDRPKRFVIGLVSLLALAALCAMASEGRAGSPVYFTTVSVAPRPVAAPPAPTVQDYDRELSRLKAGGMSAPAAVRKIEETRPELHRALMSGAR